MNEILAWDRAPRVWVANSRVWVFGLALGFWAVASVPALGADVVWTEANAGSTLETAENVAVDPTDRLVQINGTINPAGDAADLFRIEIFEPAAFMAMTVGGDADDPDLEFDAALSLFDADGFGVYSNDDEFAGFGDAALPAGNAFSPISPGIYYLAIHDDNYAALSALSASGVIFGDSPEPFTAIVGPTGPGGENPLLDFGTLDSVPPDPRAYSIVLNVPEPAPLVSLFAGVLTVAKLAGFRRRSA